MPKKRAETLPKWCKKGVHYLATEDDIANDGRCIKCRRDREGKKTPGRFVFPQPCRKGEHELRSEKDCIEGTMRCIKCDRLRKRRMAQRKAELAELEAGPAQPAPLAQQPEEKPARPPLYMFTLKRLREGLGYSEYEFASFSHIPIAEYRHIEECERRADGSEQIKLTNGLWLARRNYERRVKRRVKA